jgi:LPXTG-site transpeptidase (sortase) family protein
MENNSSQNLLDVILLKKFAFLATFFAVFVVSYSVLAWVDFLPEPVETVAGVNNSTDTGSEEKKDGVTTATETTSSIEGVLEDFDDAPVAIQARVLPYTLIIDSLDRSVPILNPVSRKVSDLDEALLEGLVRHPDSATLEQQGTVFILGHSSYLPVVNNKNFQALNGIQNLKWGDIIRLQSDDIEYVYRVDSVYRAEAQDTTVPIAGPTQRLVLATCNSFGSINDRYMVEADLLETKTI